MDKATALYVEADDERTAVQMIYSEYPALRISQPLFAWDWVTNDMLEFDVSQEVE